MRGSYENHPGINSKDCPLRITVDPHFTGMSSRGFSCMATGGHCIPCEHCKARIKDFVEEDPLDGIY